MPRKFKPTKADKADLGWSGAQKLYPELDRYLERGFGQRMRIYNQQIDDTGVTSMSQTEVLQRAGYSYMI